MTNDFFNIIIQYVILSTDIAQNKKYVLSLDNEKIRLPYLKCDKSNIENINIEIINHIKNFIYLSDMELIPQIVSFNDSSIPNKTDNTAYIIYGFLVRFTPSINSCYWKEFDYFKPNEFTQLIVKVIQNLI